MMFLTTLLLIFATPVWTAKILAVLPTVSPSHYIWTRILPLELVARGHQVTLVSPNRVKEGVQNLTEIFLEGSYDFASYDFDYETDVQLTAFESVLSFYHWGEGVCDYQLSTNGTKELIKLAETEKFDLVIMETLINECFYPFISKFGSPPTIGLSGFELPIWISYMVGNPEPFAYVRSGLTTYTNKMTFKERLHNTLVNLFNLYYRNYVVMPKFQEMAEKRLGHPVPSILETEKQFSMIFANLIIGVDYSRPLLPSVIPIGGIHIQKPKPLPKDLKDFMDNAKDGVILFSLGSNLKSNKLTDSAREALLGAFSLLPQKILWKWESDTLPGKPENVKISKWLPQTDILAHPNTRLFISHCGLMSTHETMYRGVPVVGIPFFADQHTNLLRMKLFGFAEGVEFKSMTKEILLETIKKVLHTPSYTENVKKISSVFRDQPDQPLERAVFWTEYILRHNGAKHLRSAALDLCWYQYFLLDVIAVILIATVLVIWTIYFITKSIFRLLCNVKKVKRE